MTPGTDRAVVLVLGGGNALGAYQAGAYVALHRRGVAVERIVGASVGAINGALIAGNAPEERVTVLERFWRPGGAAGARFPSPWSDTDRRTAAATWAVATGRSDVFRPLAVPPWLRPTISLYDTAPLAAGLSTLVDFDRLNDGTIRYAATAVDLESGEDVAFDTRAQRVGLEHVMASAALPVAFPPVAIGERLYVDGGMAANLPIDPVLEHWPERDTLVLALDLLPLAAPRPRTLGEMASRAQDLGFAAQSRRSLARWHAEHRHRADDPVATALTLVRIDYAEQGREIAGKAFDFSPESVGERWRIGERDMEAVLDRIEAGDIPLDRPGLAIVAAAGLREER